MSARTALWVNSRFSTSSAANGRPLANIEAVRRGATSDNGYTQFEIECNFDPILQRPFDEIIKGKGPQWFWLLFGECGCLTPMLKSFDQRTKTAILICDEKKKPNVLGVTWAYLSPYWQAFNVWMVLDPNWGWERRQFQGTDAVAEDYAATDVSLVGGRQIRVWTKLEPTGGNRGQSRHYPAADQSLPVRSGPRLVPGAWGHEHCELCHEHIDAGMFGYLLAVDRQQREFIPAEQRGRRTA